MSFYVKQRLKLYGFLIISILTYSVKSIDSNLKDKKGPDKNKMKTECKNSLATFFGINLEDNKFRRKHKMNGICGYKSDYCCSDNDFKIIYDEMFTNFTAFSLEMDKGLKAALVLQKNISDNNFKNNLDGVFTNNHFYTIARDEILRISVSKIKEFQKNLDFFIKYLSSTVCYACTSNKIKIFNLDNKYFTAKVNPDVCKDLINNFQKLEPTYLFVNSLLLLVKAIKIKEDMYLGEFDKIQPQNSALFIFSTIKSMGNISIDSKKKDIRLAKVSCKLLSSPFKTPMLTTLQFYLNYSLKYITKYFNKNNNLNIDQNSYSIYIGEQLTKAPFENYFFFTSLSNYEDQFGIEFHEMGKPGFLGHILPYNNIQKEVKTDILLYLSLFGSCVLLIVLLYFLSRLSKSKITRKRKKKYRDSLLNESYSPSKFLSSGYNKNESTEYGAELEYYSNEEDYDEDNQMVESRISE